LNSSANCAAGDHGKPGMLSGQKMKGEICRRVTLSSFDDIANLIA
jgi:hypothetical protein